MRNNIYLSIILSLLISILVLGLSYCICNAQVRSSAKIPILYNYNATYEVKTIASTVGRIDAYGTAVALRCRKDKPILLLTAAHIISRRGIIDPNIPILVSQTKADLHIVRVKKVNHKLDLAILEGFMLLDTDCPQVEISMKSPKIGDDVWVIGTHPREERVVSKGIIGRIQPDNNILTYRIDAEIDYGYSGGGAFNSHGKLIGIIRGLALSPSRVMEGKKKTKYISYSILSGSARITSLIELKHFLGVKNGQ